MRKGIRSKRNAMGVAIKAAEATEMVATETVVETDMVMATEVVTETTAGEATEMSIGKRIGRGITEMRIGIGIAEMRSGKRIGTGITGTGTRTVNTDIRVMTNLHLPTTDRARADGHTVIVKRKIDITFVLFGALLSGGASLFASTDLCA